jgi:dTDP-4-dehydrorhamnose 3,5-epimerase
VKLIPLGIPGVFRLELEPHFDERGAFARTFEADEFARHGLASSFVQWSLSRNVRRGTLRGMHWQAEPHGEAKLVRCVRGRIHDLALDLRPGSPAFRRHLAVELTADSGDALYLPPGVAHGFLTLEDDCEVHYAMSTPYVAGAARGVRWNDPAFGIVLPAPVEVISARDRGWPDFVAPGEGA